MSAYIVLNVCIHSAIFLHKHAHAPYAHVSLLPINYQHLLIKSKQIYTQTSSGQHPPTTSPLKDPHVMSGTPKTRHIPVRLEVRQFWFLGRVRRTRGRQMRLTSVWELRNCVLVKWCPHWMAPRSHICLNRQLALRNIRRLRLTTTYSILCLNRHCIHPNARTYTQKRWWGQTSVRHTWLVRQMRPFR